MEIVIPLVEGFEEIEAVAVIDVLRRAGIKVTTAGAPSTIVLGAHGLQIVTDKKMDSIEFKEFEKVVSDRFERMFNGTYGNYGRSYTLRDFGPVKIGKGYLVKELSDTFVER